MINDDDYAFGFALLCLFVCFLFSAVDVTVLCSCVGLRRGVVAGGLYGVCCERMWKCDCLCTFGWNNCGRQ